MAIILNQITMKLTKQDKIELSKQYNLEPAVVDAVDAVESGGKGFNDDGKIVIQFEPHHFWKYDTTNYKRYQAIVKEVNKGKQVKPLDVGFYNVYSEILKNKVSGQLTEWNIFNKAFKLNPNAAMMATSIGRMQVMGFNHKTVGFKTVNEMWDYAKVSEKNQLELGLRFIAASKKMMQALKNKQFDVFASIYNGPKYKDFKYDTRLTEAYNKALKLY